MPYSTIEPFPQPYLYTGLNAKQHTLLVLILLSFQLIAMGVMRDGGSIRVILSAATASACAASLIAYRHGRITFDLQAFVTGLLMGFLFPCTDSGTWSFCIAFISYLFSWGLFGGKGYSWINPIALAACIAAICKPGSFVPPVSLDKIASSGSIFAAMENTGLLQAPVDQYLTSVLNSTFLHKVGVTLPEGYISLLLYYPSVIPAFRYNLLTLICSIILLSTKTLHKTLPFTFLATYALLVYFFPSAQHANAYGKGNILSALLTSGVLFSAFFVLGDNGSLPRSWQGRCITGLLTGICTFCIAGYGITAAGVPFAVLSVNCFNPLIEWLESYWYKRRRGTV